MPLNDEDVARIQKQEWHKNPDFQNVQVMVRYQATKKSFRLAHRQDGSCVFLNEHGLCRIHAEFGFEAKPTICRVFPLQLIPRNGKAVLTIRRACPSAVKDLGVPLKEHLPLVQQFVNESRLSTKSISPPPLKHSDVRDWEIVELALETASALLRDERYPPVRRVVHASQFANLLNVAKTKSMNDKKLGELIRTLAQIVPEESKPFFQERRRPGNYSRIIFRSIGIEFARLHPRFRAEPSWTQRFELAKSLYRLVRGRGRLPNLNPAFPIAKLENLEEPLSLSNASIEKALTRLIEASSASFTFALCDRRGWSVVESILGLVLMFPVGLWLLRWASHGREPTSEDMVQIAVALDRGQGFAPLTGQLQRMRLQLLASQGELERTVVWYVR